MPRKIIIDCDPGIDDAVALCVALYDLRLEVVAVTAVEGSVPAQQASRNVQAIIEQLDPPRFPRIGAASPADSPPPVDARRKHGEDGLGGAGLAVSQRHHQHPSEKILCDEVRGAPGQITILCLGPLTNVARAFRRDPELPGLVDRLIILGGSVDGIGDVTPAAEFNMYYDPISAREVFRSATTKTLIPLDVTRRVNFTLEFVERLPPETTRAGWLLRRIVPYTFRFHHQTLGQESIHLHECVALAAALRPDLFRTRELAGDVETRGELTTGATIFDRRPNASARANMEVAVRADSAEIAACITRGLVLAGRAG